MILAAIDPRDESILLSHHTDKESVTVDIELQQPEIAPEEVAAEVHEMLVTSIMVGAPV